MKFLLMILDNPQAWARVSPEEAERVVGEHYRLAGELQQAGKLVDGQRLQGPETARRVRLEGGRRAVTDGPFAETKEVLGGYYLVDVASAEEALEWARRLPLLEGDAVEVRPVWVE